MSGKNCGKRKRSNSGPAGQATHSPSSPTLPLALATDTREPAAQDDAAAEEQRGQPDGLDNHIGELSAAENRVDEWKRKWTAANPTLELPDDIARMITDFAELAKPPSMARFNLALDALNAASNSESLDSIREAIAQVNMERVIYTQSLSVFEISLKKAFRLADDIKSAVSGSYVLLDRPVACIHSPGKTTPSLHKVDNRRKFSGTPKLMAIDVQGYVSEIRRMHPGLMSSRVKLGDNNLARSNKERMISCEQDMMPYFQSEIAPRIAHILQHRRPEALVEVIEGRATNHADLFLKVTSLNANGKTVTSSVAIEFKKPYGDEHLPVTPEIPTHISLARLAQ
ncbi:hypothetical protein IWW57_001410 [Coemansia sp. S610]|nr:hypothetical protein IWW57_001410 [Coemansia sp. S610]